MQRNAEALLNKDISYEPGDKFIDCVVSSENGYVLFSKHSKSESIYGYFPDREQALNATKLTWIELEDNWFYAKIEYRKN